MKRLLTALTISVALLLFLAPQNRPVFAIDFGNNIPCTADSQCKSGFCNKIAGPAGLCKPVLTCKCTDSGKAATFTCEQDGKKGDGKCKKPKLCHNKPNAIADNDIFETNPINAMKDIVGGTGLKGITCADENELAKPPPPPCEGFAANGSCSKIKTSIGTLETDPARFVTSVFAVLLSMAGGIGVLLIIRAGYHLMMSAGKPEAVQNGRDELIAAIVGLLFLIFSLVILQVIGVDILRIPNSSGNPQPNKTINKQASCTSAGGFCETSGACNGEPGYFVSSNPGCTGGKVCCIKRK